jgi:hypothetical protein
MKTSYFTFGQNHVHKINNIIFDKDCVVMIQSENPIDTMFEVFGEKWAMQYDKEPDLSWYPRGIIKLDI